MDIHVIPQTQIDDGRASVSVLDSVVSSPNNPLIHLRFGGRMEFADEHTAGATTSNSDRHKPSDTRYGVDLSSSDNDTEDVSSSLYSSLVSLSICKFHSISFCLLCFQSSQTQTI